MNKKENFMVWSFKNILSKDCTYNIIIGKRNSGKNLWLKKYDEYTSKLSEQNADLRKIGDKRV